MKTCKDCGIEKDKFEFYKGRGNCKCCYSLNRKPPTDDQKQHQRTKSLEYYHNHKEERLEYRKKYDLENKESIKNYNIVNREKIKLRRTVYQRNHRKENVSARISSVLRTRLNSALNRNLKNSSAIKDLGCSLDEFKLHLITKFYPNSKTGEEMTWENWGNGSGKWQIDHIIEFRDIDITNKEELDKILHYTNLQPLWFDDHSKKTGNPRRPKKSLDN